MDRVSPNVDASAGGPEGIDEEALTVPEQARVSFVVAGHTPQARRVR